MIDLVPVSAAERCESLRSVISGCGKCFTYINPLKDDKFLPVSSRDRFPLPDILRSMKEFERRSELYRAIGGGYSVLFQHSAFSVFNEAIGRRKCFDKIAGVLLRRGR